MPCCACCVQIFRLDCEGGTRGTASGTLWREDLQWARSLDAGWNLNHVKAVARGVMERLGRGRDSSPAHWLDEGTEHPHRRAERLLWAYLPIAAADADADGFFPGWERWQPSGCLGNHCLFSTGMSLMAGGGCCMQGGAECGAVGSGRGGVADACWAGRRRGQGELWTDFNLGSSVQWLLLAGWLLVRSSDWVMVPAGWQAYLLSYSLSDRCLAAATLQAQIIISGVGDWRYVDCVSQRAGKLAALEYVRSLYSIPR